LRASGPHPPASSAATLETQAPLYDRCWADGSLPPVLAACASTPTVGGFYLDQPGDGGQWETLAAQEFPAHLAREFGADLSRLAITGASMGGYGALKIAFRQPERFIAVAAMAPAVFPGETADQVPPRNTPSVLGQLLAEMRDSPAGYSANHVVAVLRAGADAIRRSGLSIMVECGDQDSFGLADGAEYLHRVLRDLDVSHDYHLIGGADHVGPEVPRRQADVLLFLGNALNQPRP
jgi:S-formylglutathione hydrolase